MSLIRMEYLGLSRNINKQILKRIKKYTEECFRRTLRKMIVVMESNQEMELRIHGLNMQKGNKSYLM
jgi:hypothetical protein